MALKLDSTVIVMLKGECDIAFLKDVNNAWFSSFMVRLLCYLLLCYRALTLFLRVPSN